MKVDILRIFTHEVNFHFDWSSNYTSVGMFDVFHYIAGAAPT